MIDGEQIENAALAAGEGRHLPVDGLSAQGGVERFDVGSRLRFQPRLGVLAVERMAAVFGLRGTGTVQLFHQALDFRDMMRTRRAALAHAEEELGAGEFGELDAAYAETGAAIV